MPDYTTCPYCLEKILSGTNQCEHCDSLLAEKARQENPGEVKSGLQKNGEQSQLEGGNIETDLPATVHYSKASPPQSARAGQTEPGTGKAAAKKSNARVIAAVALVVVFIVMGSFAFTYYLLSYRGSEITAEETATIVDDETEEKETQDVSVDIMDDAEVEEKDSEDNGVEESPESKSQEFETVSEPEPVPETAPVVQTAVDNKGEPTRGSISWDGGTYTGTLVDGVPHGRGTWSDATRKSYTGEFKEGKITGYGTMIFPGGAMYVGYFKDGKGHGEGTMTHLDGRSVSGTWIEGEYQDE